jgi:hypothetical protein
MTQTMGTANLQVLEEPLVAHLSSRLAIGTESMFARLPHFSFIRFQAKQVWWALDTIVSTDGMEMEDETRNNAQGTREAQWGG